MSERFRSRRCNPLKEEQMGLTVLRLLIANAATPDEGEEVEFLVDSGAVYSVVPAASSA